MPKKEEEHPSVWRNNSNTWKMATSAAAATPPPATASLTRVMYGSTLRSRWIIRGLFRRKRFRLSEAPQRQTSRLMRRIQDEWVSKCYLCYLYPEVHVRIIFCLKHCCPANFEVDVIYSFVFVFVGFFLPWFRIRYRESWNFTGTGIKAATNNHFHYIN